MDVLERFTVRELNVKIHYNWIKIIHWSTFRKIVADGCFLKCLVEN